MARVLDIGCNQFHTIALVGMGFAAFARRRQNGRDAGAWFAFGGHEKARNKFGYMDFILKLQRAIKTRTTYGFLLTRMFMKNGGQDSCQTSAHTPAMCGLSRGLDDYKCDVMECVGDLEKRYRTGPVHICRTRENGEVQLCGVKCELLASNSSR